MAVGDLPSPPDVIESLRQAWTNIWPHFWWLLLFGLIAGIASNIDAGYSTELTQEVSVTIDIVGGLIGIFLGIPLSMGVTKAHLAASRGVKPTWSDLGFAFGPRYLSSVALGVLAILIIIGGLILLIIPGIYLAVRLVFATPRFIEDDLGPVDAVKASFADTKGRWWSCFGLVLLAIPLFIAGALALLVGVFVAMVLVPQMVVVYWRSLSGGRTPEDAPHEGMPDEAPYFGDVPPAQ